MTVLRDMEVLEVSHKYSLSPGSMKAQAFALFERGYSTKDVGYLLRRLRKGKILIIDDDLELLESLRLSLTQLGHDATCTANGTAGLSLVQRMKFDLVITDLGMPGMGGADVAICIKDINPDIPTLLITGWGIQIDSKQMALMKIEGVLHKPFTRAELAETVNKLLK